MRVKFKSNMLKNKVLLGSILATFVFNNTHISSAVALELDEDTRTVTLNPKGDTVISVEQVAWKGLLFNNACGTCHVMCY